MVRAGVGARNGTELGLVQVGDISGLMVDIL